MKPWKCLDRAPTPDGRGELSLYQRGEELVIRVDGSELMSSRQHHSEDALAEISCRGLGPAPRVCVAGLGMGYTLAKVLDAVDDEAQVCVVEFSAAVVEWNRGPLAALADHPLDDPRCSIAEEDIVAHLADESVPRYDAILLDVDNGPEALSQRDNAWLYDERGIRAIGRKLRPRGVLAVWSAGPDAPYSRRLRKAGFSLEVHPVRSHRKGSGRRHQVWIARPPKQRR